MSADIEARYQADAGTLIALLRRAGLSPEDAEDMAAEAWLRAWQCRETLRAEVWPWLLTVTRRLRIDAYRHHHRLSLVALDDALPAGANVERDALANLTAAAVLTALAGLPDSQRVVTMLRALEWSYAEIAAATGRPVNALRVAHYRGRRRVARLMERGAA